MDYSKIPQRNRQNRKPIKDQFIEQVKVILHQFSPNLSEADIDKIAKQTVKIWDKESSDFKSIEEYSTRMTQKFSKFEQDYRQKQQMQQQNQANAASPQKDPYWMVMEMKEALPQIRNFKETTTFIGQNDMKLLDQLINFINNFANQPRENLIKEKDSIKLYYDRLFGPIHKTIKKKLAEQSGQQQSNMAHTSPPAQMNQSPPVDHNQMGSRVPSQSHLPPSQVQQQNSASQMQSQTQGPPLRPAQMQQQYQQKMQQMSPQPPMQTRAQRQPPNQTSPVQSQMPPSSQQQQMMHQPMQRMPQQMQQQQQQQQAPDTPMDPIRQIQMLFTQVRSECAVFYATPHPPHF